MFQRPSIRYEKAVNSSPIDSLFYLKNRFCLTGWRLTCYATIPFFLLVGL